MYIDFHTHGKLAKYLPFSTTYTDWLLNEAKNAGLDAICLTEHFNTQQFDELYNYIASNSYKLGDAFIFNGLKIFAGMETDIAEGGHVLSIGTMDTILELNKKLEPYKKSFLPFKELIKIFKQYPILIGAGHPFREGGNIPKLSPDMLENFDFIDLNGKDIAENREKTQTLTYAFSKQIKRPVVAGSDTHQAIQYGCVSTKFKNDFNTIDEMKKQLNSGDFTININQEAKFKVKTATILKRALKEIHALGGDYISVLIKNSGESPAVLQAKKVANS